MPTFDVNLARPTGIFYIFERLYSRDWMMPSVGSLGPSLTQIHRTVIQLRRKQDMYMDGEKIQPKDITLWQQIKYLTGTKVTTKDTDGLVYLLEFMGTLLASAPLPGFENKNIPRFLTSEETYSLPNIMNYGRDPIPNILLYGRSNVTFFMDNGGRGNPTAIAKYNVNNNDLALISDQAQASSIMKNILPRGVKK